MRALLLTTALLVACDDKGTEEEEVDTTVDTVDTTDTTDVVVGLGIGETAPDFTLADQNGNLVSLSDYSGQRVMIVGTASW